MGAAASRMGNGDEGGQQWRQEAVRWRRPGSARRAQPQQTPPLREGLQGSVQPAGSPDKVQPHSLSLCGVLSAPAAAATAFQLLGRVLRARLCVARNDAAS